MQAQFRSVVRFSQHFLRQQSPAIDHSILRFLMNEYHILNQKPQHFWFFHTGLKIPMAAPHIDRLGLPTGNRISSPFCLTVPPSEPQIWILWQREMERGWGWGWGAIDYRFRHPQHMICVYMLKASKIRRKTFKIFDISSLKLGVKKEN